MVSGPSLDRRFNVRWNIDHHLHTQTSNALADAKASLRPCLTLNCRKEFLLTCWHLQLNDPCSDKELRTYQSYFSHYEESCTYLPTSYPLLEDCTHAHFCQAVQPLQRGTRKLCERTIETLLPPTSRTPEAARDCISFIGKAILLIDLSGWSADETLREFIARTVASHSTQKDQYRISLVFNARAFEKVADALWPSPTCTRAGCRRDRDRPPEPKCRPGRRWPQVALKSWAEVAATT